MPSITPPAGYTIDQPNGITPPPGYSLDAPSQPSVPDAGARMRGNALNLARQSMDQSGNIQKPSHPYGGAPSVTVNPDQLEVDHPVLGGIVNMPGRGVEDIGTGIARLSTPGQRLSGAHELITGVGKLAAIPALSTGVIAGPIGTATGLAIGTGASAGAERLARWAGASPDVADLAGDAGGLAAGIGIPKLFGTAGSLLKAPASPMAESALSIRDTDRAYGATPGRAILEETSGFRPSSIEASANRKLAQLNDELTQRSQASHTPASLGPARNVLTSATRAAKAANSEETPRLIEPLLRQLTIARPGFTGETDHPITIPATRTSPIADQFGRPVQIPEPAISGPAQVAEQQAPIDLLGMKRQFNRDFIGNRGWKSNAPDHIVGTARNAYHALDQELDRTVPGASELDQRMSSLIPVADRAGATDLHAGALQRTLGRIGHPTGALIAGIEGLRRGGLPGLALGLGLPELASTPTAQMVGARGLWSAGKNLKSAGPVAAPASMLAPFVLKRKDD